MGWHLSKKLLTRTPTGVIILTYVEVAVIISNILDESGSDEGVRKDEPPKLNIFQRYVLLGSE